MTEEIQQLLKNLRLRKIAEMIESELAAARKTSPSHTDLLARLLRAEWLDQQERRYKPASSMLTCPSSDFGVILQPRTVINWQYARLTRRWQRSWRVLSRRQEFRWLGSTPKLA